MERKPVAQEQIKEDSLYLKGEIIKELADEESPFVSDASYELLKFHGSYQGYNRDTATERKKAGLEKEWEFMLRMKSPAGRLTAEQYLAIDGICEEYANGSMRVTTRETFQFHCIVKGDLKGHIAALNRLAISTLGGCGDVVRNITCSHAPLETPKYKKMREDSFSLARFCAPRTDVYHEIWMDGENMAVPEELPSETQQVKRDGDDSKEPLYGKHYLPRKFKIALGFPEDNSADVLTHDLGFIMMYDGDKLLGYNVYVGGGLGMTHNKKDTYPRLASPIAFVKPDELLDAAEAVIKIHRDFGDRTNRKHARIKYVVEENGVDWTIKTFGEYFGKPFEPAKKVNNFIIPDWMGRHPQGDGKWFIGVPVDSGRIKDDETTNIRKALREVVETYAPMITLTADQNIALGNLAEEDLDKIEAILKRHGVKLREDITDAHRFMLACVALPTCGKALAEAERVKLPLIDMVEHAMDKHGVKDDKISVRITGCPNGCARPYVGDIGIVGRMAGHYALYIGGDFHGTRLNTKIFDRVPFDRLEGVFDVFFKRYAAEKNDNELFGDYAERIGSHNLAEDAAAAFEGEKWAKVHAA